MLLHTLDISWSIFSTLDPFLAGLRFSEDGSVELVGEGRLLEELDPLPLSPYHIKGTLPCGREEDRLSIAVLVAERSRSSLVVLFNTSKKHLG